MAKRLKGGGGNKRKDKGKDKGKDKEESFSIPFSMLKLLPVQAMKKIFSTATVAPTGNQRASTSTNIQPFRQSVAAPFETVRGFQELRYIPDYQLNSSEIINRTHQRLDFHKDRAAMLGQQFVPIDPKSEDKNRYYLDIREYADGELNPAELKARYAPKLWGQKDKFNTLFGHDANNPLAKRRDAALKASGRSTFGFSQVASNRATRTQRIKAMMAQGSNKPWMTENSSYVMALIEADQGKQAKQQLALPVFSENPSTYFTGASTSAAADARPFNRLALSPAAPSFVFKPLPKPTNSNSHPFSTPNTPPSQFSWPPKKGSTLNSLPQKKQAPINNGQSQPLKKRGMYGPPLQANANQSVSPQGYGTGSGTSLRPKLSARSNTRSNTRKAPYIIGSTNTGFTNLFSGRSRE